MKLNSALILDIVYPIGSYYWNNSLIDIDNVIGGHWVRVKDKFVLAVGDTYAANSSGGAASHEHKLPIGMNSGTDKLRFYRDYLISDGGVHNLISYVNEDGKEDTGITSAYRFESSGASNLPPYETAYCWRRES